MKRSIFLYLNLFVLFKINCSFKSIKIKMKPKGLIGKLDFTKLKSSKTSETIANEQHFKLDDSALIKLNENDIHLIRYKELKDLKLIGSGEFGIVKKMIHEPSRLEFAVKVSIENLQF